MWNRNKIVKEDIPPRFSLRRKVYVAIYDDSPSQLDRHQRFRIIRGAIDQITLDENRVQYRVQRESDNEHGLNYVHAESDWVYPSLDEAMAYLQLRALADIRDLKVE